ncbi:MAG: GreA/GreB family elongation factor [Chthoniobacterales bacterium]
MSRAFVKEDVDPPERSGRTRSASGLPPGATNYITARGARRLRAELEKAQPDRRAELKEILASVRIVEPPDEPSESVAFGAVVTVEDQSGETQSYQVVGVEELDFTPNAVSWISAMGKTLLAGELGDRVTLGDAGTVRIVKVDYPQD